jgi:hypothetical protein
LAPPLDFLVVEGVGAAGALLAVLPADFDPPPPPPWPACADIGNARANAIRMDDSRMVVPLFISAEFK